LVVGAFSVKGAADVESSWVIGQDLDAHGAAQALDASNEAHDQPRLLPLCGARLASHRD